MNGKGTWRAVHTALVDHPDYQRLSSEARLVLLVCRVGSLNTMASIFHYYRAVLEAQTGLKADVLEAALEELGARPSRTRPWVIRDAEVLWIRNGLRFDPNMTLDNPNHVTAVLRVLSALPSSSLVVRKFRRYYKLASGSYPRSPGGSHPLSPGGSGIQRQKQKERLKRDGERERETAGDVSPAPSLVAVADSHSTSNYPGRRYETVAAVLEARLKDELSNDDADRRLRELGAKR